MEQESRGKEITKEIIEENVPEFNKILSSTLKSSINIPQNKYRKAHIEAYNENFIKVIKHDPKTFWA